MHVISLNGPPGVGKDTIARMLRDQHGFVILQFKQLLFDITETILGPDNFSLFMGWYNDRELKERPMDMLNGLSPRQFFILISEEWVKPVFGQSYFGRKVGSQAREVTTRRTHWGNPGYDTSPARSVVFPDGGFEGEMRALLNYCPQAQVVRLHRDGFDFSGDSRSYVYGPRAFDVVLEHEDPQSAVDNIMDVLRDEGRGNEHY